MSRKPQGHLYRRGRIWWCWFYRSGQLIRESTMCASRRAAELVLTDREAAAAGGAASAGAAPWSVSQALQALLDSHPWPSDRTEAAHASRTCQLARLIGAVDLALLERRAVEGYVAARRAEGKKDHTIFKELVLLRLALRKAKEDGHWSGDIEALFPRHRANYVPRERWLEPLEAEALLAEVLPHRRLWLQVALFTGARFDEVNALSWEDVSFERETIRVRGTKTAGADRTIGLAPQLRAILYPLRLIDSGRPRTGPVVQSWGQAGRDIKAACARIQRTRRAAQVARGEPPTAVCLPATPNDLRRTTASWMAVAGVPPLHIARMLGHKSLEMVMRVYARVNPAALTAAAAALPSLDCEAGVLRGGRLSASSGLYTTAPSENPQRAPGVSEWACSDLNRGPLASEAKSHKRKGS